MIKQKHTIPEPVCIVVEHEVATWDEIARGNPDVTNKSTLTGLYTLKD